MFLYKRFGAKYLKKWLDDPLTPEDESAAVVAFGEKAVKLAVEAAVAKAIAEAMKNPGVDKAAKAAELLYGEMAGRISKEDAKKLVDRAMAGK